MNLAELFPDTDYRFHLTLRRVEPRTFFAPQDPSGRVLKERRQWLVGEPTHYLGVSDGSEPLIAEFAELATSWGLVSLMTGGAKQLRALGEALEPDILFLSPDSEGHFRLRAGALCFPTGWAIEEKLGQTLDVVHGVVPGLNPALAAPIQQFLAKLKPGAAYLRDNWGLAATDQLNLHPSRQIAPPSAPVSLERLWLRVEHQALLALPRTRGIVFGIRIALHRLDEVARSSAAPGLRRALQTLPAELTRYKRLDRVRDEVVRLL